MLGSVTLGYLSDKLFRTRSPVAFFAVICATVMSFIISFKNAEMSQPVFMLLMFVFGFFVSGLNNIVSGSCAADIGK